MNRKRLNILFLILILSISSLIPADALPSDSNNGITGEEANVAPQISFQIVKPKSPVDIIILTDYTGQKLADLQASANNLKTVLIPQNYDVNYQYIQDTTKVGKIHDYLRRYHRYAYFTYKWDHIQWWSPVKADDLYNQTYTTSSTVETKDCLETQAHTLPYRQYAYVSHYEDIGGHSTTTTDYSDIRLHLSGDVRPYVDTSYSYAYQSKNGDSGRIFEGWHFVSHNVDRTFSAGEVINSVYTDLNILDADKISTLPLREESTRYLVIATEGKNSTGNITTPLQTYIKNNNIKVKASINELAHDWLLTQENYVKKVFACDKEIYYLTRTGKLLRTGADSGSEYFADVTDQFPGVDNISCELGYTVYYTGKKPKYIKTSEGIIRSFPFTDIVDISFGSGYSYGNYALVRLADGKLYDYKPDTGSYKLLINNIMTMPSTGIYDSYSRTIGPMFGNPAQFSCVKKIDYGNITITYAVNFDGQDSVHIYYYDSWYRRYRSRTVPVSNIKRVSKATGNSVFVLTNDNKLYEFQFEAETVYEIPGTYTKMPDSTNYSNYEHKFTGTPVYPDYRTVKKSYPTAFSTICENEDGTVQYVGIGGIGARKEGPKGDKYWVYSIIPTPLTMTSVNGIKKIQTVHYYTQYGTLPNSDTYILDNNGDLYCYNDYWKDNYGGSYWRKIVSNVTDFALEQGIDSQTKKLGAPVYYTVSTDKVLKYMSYYVQLNNVESITSNLSTIIAILSDGSARGRGKSEHYELGQGTYEYIDAWVNPLKSRLTIDNLNLPYLRMNDLIRSNPSFMYYAQGKPQPAFDDIAKELAYNSGSSQAYILLNEPIASNTAYTDYESDPEYRRRWIYTHDPAYFENSLGLDSNSGKLLISPLTSFSKVGKYYIELKARDNPKPDDRFDAYRLWSPKSSATVYVHRRPVAQLRFNIYPSSNGLYHVEAIDAGSYDLDHYSKANHGITAWDWRWKEEAEGSWHNERMNRSDCDPDKRYVIQLRVKDMEGVWSDYCTMDVDNDNPPEALFNIDKFVINISENLKLRDQSFPRSFATIKSWHWIVKKLNRDGSVPAADLQNKSYGSSNNGTGAMAGCDINVKTKYNDTGVGKYRVYLRVKDSNGLWSDRGTAEAPNLVEFCSLDFEVDRPPAASFTIEKNPIFVEESLRLKDTSISMGITPIISWHWIVKKLNADGEATDTDIQNAKFTNCNNGAGALQGCDVNVKTNYADVGPGTYRIYLRVMNRNGMWSDGGGDSAYNLERFYRQDLAVEESFKISDFRVVQVRDLHLRSYYYNSGTGGYDDRPIYVNGMAVDYQNFGGLVDGLTKGYVFEFEIDTQNFNEAKDTIRIMPRFYTCDYYTRDVKERELYWEDSNHQVLKAGDGGHAAWELIELTKDSRTENGDSEATWRGSYLIPGTAWAVPLGTSAENAKKAKIDKDIIVNFDVKGYRDGEQKYDYNLKQWPLERTVEKYPYEIGDVIRYSYLKNNLDDIEVILNRP